jgi:hypothetical protein
LAEFASISLRNCSLFIVATRCNRRVVADLILAQTPKACVPVDRPSSPVPDARHTCKSSHVNT